MPSHPESLMYPSIGKTSASTNTQPPWNPTKGLTNLHMQVIRLSVLGMADSKIRYELKRYDKDLSMRHIRRVRESLLGRRYASFYSAQVHKGTAGLVEAIGEHLPTAVFVETNIMEDPYAADRHRLNAAQDLLDRGGVPKISRQENDAKIPQTVIINLTPSQLSQFMSPPVQVVAETVPLLANPPSSDE